MEFENVAVIASPLLSKLCETRYVVVDQNTGKILDDAQGYGYKSEVKAYSSYAYKNGLYHMVLPPRIR